MGQSPGYRSSGEGEAVEIKCFLLRSKIAGNEKRCGCDNKDHF